LEATFPEKHLEKTFPEWPVDNPDAYLNGGGKASTVSEPGRLGKWTMCGHETEFSQAVDNPEEALSPMASGKSPCSWLGVRHRFLNHRRHRSEAFPRKEEQVAEEDTAENVLTGSVHMFKTEVRQRTCEYEKYLFQVVDKPEEALSPMASAKPRRRCPRWLPVNSLGWWGVKHRQTGFQTLFGILTIFTKHTVPRPRGPARRSSRHCTSST